MLRAALTWFLEVMWGICSAKPVSEALKQSAVSYSTNWCDKTPCRSICWLPPTSQGLSQVLMVILPEHFVNISLGEWDGQGL